LVAYGALALVVLALGGRWLTSGARGGAGGGAEQASTVEARRPAGSGVVVRAPSRELVVHVAGAVRKPGVYRMPAGSRVQDAVRGAGGATGKGDANAVNLAAPVQDGVQVIVPAKVAGGVAAAPVAAVPGDPAAPPGPPVNLNTATAEQLDTLDGVGPSTAAKILDYRRQHGGFRTVDDLGQVTGIGPKKLAALRGKVTT